jgi:hypothetical protein
VRRAIGLVVAGLALLVGRVAPAQSPYPGTERLDSLRFTFLFTGADRQLARSLMTGALARDSFPGLPHPRERVTIAVAPDARRFREWVGPGAPEWGAAIAFTQERRIVLQGRRASSLAGDPRAVVRHELAHLALREALDGLPPRWFDEGYASFAAGEWGRSEVLATNLALALRGVPRLDELDDEFAHGASRAQQAYALAYLAVAEIAALDPARGLSLFFAYWKESESFDLALRRAYGMTETTFEERWRAGTRRRFGALALVTDLSLGIVVLLLVLGPLWALRLQRDRQRMAAMRASDEAQERRERESALEDLLFPGHPPASPPQGTAPNENPIK